MGKISGEEGWISLGPWGGRGGTYSTYKPDGPIVQITIRYGDVVDSILFESKRRDGVVIGSSVKIGGTGGGSSAKFSIDSSVEQFSFVSLTYKDYSRNLVLSSLGFSTNLRNIGPFGKGGGQYVSIPIEGEIITGFHGRGGSVLDAIGIFVAPKVKKMEEELKTKVEELKTTNKELKEREDVFQTKMKEVEAQNKELKERVKVIEVTQNQVVDLRKIEEELKNKIEELKTKNKELKEREDVFQTKMKEVEAQNKELKERVKVIEVTQKVEEELKTKIEELKERKDVFQTKMEEAEAQNKELGERIKVMEVTQVVDLHKMEEEMKANIEELKTKNKELKEKEDVFQTKMEEVEVHNKELRERIKVMEVTQSQMVDLRMIEEELKTKIEELKTKNKELKEREDAFQTKMEEVEAHNKELRERIIVIEKKGNISSEEGLISLGIQGGNEGAYWAYKANGPTLQISVRYGQVINSILFKSKSSDGIGRSVKIGGSGGYMTVTFCIDSSEEQLLSISITYEEFRGEETIVSLCFNTNLRKYGPFGSRTDTSSVSIPIEDGFIAGFHGRGGSFLDAIGIFAAPKGRISAEEGWISLGPWGGKGGGEWAYRPNGPIMQITISYKDAIHSVLFESKTRDGVVIGSSMKFGCDFGGATETFCIDSSVEQLSSINVTYGIYYTVLVIVSLRINTNLKKNGPFGLKSGAYSVSIPIEGGVIAGFHGRSEDGYDRIINAIGIFVAPKANSLPSSEKKVDSLHLVQDPDSVPAQLKGNISDEEGLISLGPWGGKDGVDWTYKPNGPIMQISICYGEAINSILFRSRSCDGFVIGSSEKIGGPGGDTTKTEMFCIDSSVEQLSSITLEYKDYYGQLVITSLCFETNIGKKHGPFGSGSGASSVSIPIKGGLIAGFFGRGVTGTYLTAIGIYVASKVNDLPSSEKKFDGFEVCKHAFSIARVYAMDALARPFQEILELMAKQLECSVEFWFLAMPWITYMILRFPFGKSFGEAPSLYLSLIAFLANCVHWGFLLSGSVLGFISLVAISLREHLSDLQEIGWQNADREDGDRNGARAARRPPGHANRNLAGEANGEDGDGAQGVAGAGQIIRTNAENVVAWLEMQSARLEAQVKQMLDGLDDADGATYTLIDKLSYEEGWMSLGPSGGKDGVDWDCKANGPNSEEGCESLGPWGGKDGVDWTYKANGPIMQISICHGEEAINSILFRSWSYDGIVIGSSEKFGGTGGNMTETFCIDRSEEQLMSISLKYDYFHGKVTITTLCFNTNLNKYGPFGLRLDHYPEPITIDGGVFGGFHGRTDGRHIIAIGVFVAPKVNSLHSIQDPDSAPIQFEVLGSGEGSKPKTLGTPTVKSKRSLRFLVPKFKADFCGSKPKTLENITIHNAASSSATTNKDDHHGGAPSPSSEMIPLATNIDGHHGGALSPTSKMIHSDLILLDMAAESMHHMNEKINQAHEKFKELQILPSSERDPDKRRKADSDKKELRKAITELKVQIRSHNKIRSTNSNPHHQNWDNINKAEDGMTHFFHREPEVADTGESNSLLKDFRDLPEPLRCCLSCFFKFPPMAVIKRTPMIYLWIGQGYISKYLHSEGYIWDVEVHAGKIFDKLITKGFIEPIYQNCSLVPDSCTMNLSVRSSIYKEAKGMGFTSNGNFDLDDASICGDLIRHSCLVNVGEAIIKCKSETFENMKHIQSLYLGRWQSSATHHIELENAKILHGLNKLNGLTFLSLRGISMITELPTFISELHNLMILDLRACHNLEVVPNNIGLLKSLTHLDLSECYCLEHMPKSLAQLSNLQVLKGFLIGDFNNNGSCSLLDLLGQRKLRKLNIHIIVKDLLRLQDLEYLERFEGLKKLKISWGRLQARAEVIAKAFPFARLPPRLQKLDLQCFPMTSTTNWLMPGKLKELKKLYIRGGQLRDLGEIQRCQEEQLTVEILHLEYLSELELYWKELRTVFPKLIYLHQVGCPKFINFPCGVWINKMAINTHVQLQKYYQRTSEPDQLKFDEGQFCVSA
ncbi:uncharacterized protein LOC131310257 [Rhododendron vialii]|uniref:uncharacterized protein LOC131310257 n=1 Tax=Rhododendron vialii TaxID=182163 RepID=UPI00265FEEBE|nr:uncharacterized protein LOC131310257 [Rhododendron vialii]